MVNWQQIRLRDISQIYSGFAFRSQDLGEQGIPVVKIANIQNKRVNPKCSDHFPEKLCTEKLNRYFLQAGDFLIAMTGAGSVGKVGKMPRIGGSFLVNQRVAIVRPDDSHCDPAFVYFALSQDFYETKLYGLGLGAGQPNVSAKQIGELEIPFPPLPVQRRIAGILSAYDELIENNQRRIRILEEMARSVYREWFVHFRYPGHESVPLTDSPLGPIPQGWEVKKLGELTSFLSRGLSPSYDDDGFSLVINQKCIRGQRLSLEPARCQKKPIPKDKQIRFGDVLINSTGVGTLGRVAQVYNALEQCTVDTHVTIARPSDRTDIDFFGCTLLCQQDNFERLGVGATGQTELGRAVIGQVELVIPPNALQLRFGALVRPIRMEAATLSNQNENLRRTRDLLLPRLLSGQIDIEATETPI